MKFINHYHYIKHSSLNGQVLSESSPKHFTLWP